MAPSAATMHGPSVQDKLKHSLKVFNHVRWEHLAAGISGGVTSTLVLHPLDLIKVRFQGKHDNVVTFIYSLYDSIMRFCHAHVNCLSDSLHLMYKISVNDTRDPVKCMLK